MPARDVLRPLVAGPLVALVLAGCGIVGGDEPPTVRATPVEEVTPEAGGTAGGDAGEGAADAEARDDQQGEADGTAAPGPGEPTAAPGPTPNPTADQPPPAEDDSPPPPSVVPVGDRGAVGSNAPAYLRGGRERLVVEVDVGPGVRLSDGVLAHLRAVLGRESDLPVELVLGGGVATQRDTWSVGDLRALADAHRDVHSDGATAAMYVAVVDGSFEREGVLGVAHTASEVALFPDEWDGLLGGLVAGDAVPRAVLVHEVGHLLGLVGLHQEPVEDHEDPEHPGHTVDRDDVMFWAVETSAVGTVFSGPPPDDFGPFTRADLAAIRGS